MSIEPEDLLETALRDDLPSAETETRLRRRLLAAGLAVGNGVATTTAAAGSAASGTATGVVAKVVGLSWGIKLGIAAAVAIPTVGLLVDGHTRSRRAVALATAPAPVTSIERAVMVGSPEPIATAEARQAAEPERAAPKNTKPALLPDPGPGAPPDVVAGQAHPSQAAFAAPEPLLRAPQVGSTLADETRLLDGAFAALAAGDRARAAELIDEHQARYPEGLLKKERERAQARLSQMSRGE